MRIASALDKYLEDSAVDATRMRIELGFEPQVSLERGWAETVAAMRQAGELPGGSTT